jgi:hypothetical protein
MWNARVMLNSCLFGNLGIVGIKAASPPLIENPELRMMHYLINTTDPKPLLS